MEWKNKIDQFQADPPPLAWDEIEKELRLDEYALYNYAGIPPLDSWNVISSKIAKPRESTQPAVFQLIRPLMRYAAILGFMALVGTIILNKPFRHAVLETFQGPGIKAALSDSQHAHKKDTSSNIPLPHQP